MHSLDAGHKYVVDSMDGTNPQTIDFIKKELVDGQFVTVVDGTTNEEILKMMIDRIQHLNNKAPCFENSYCLTYLETALSWLLKRTADRKARGVEGTPKV